MNIIKKKNDGTKEYMINSYHEDETYLKETDGVYVLKFKCLEKYSWAELAFTTRIGGISKGCLGSMNLGWDRGDERETVCANYRILCNSLGILAEDLVLSDQVHDVKVKYVDEQDCAGENIEKKLQGIDGLMTDKKNLILATSYADCVPLFFVDKEKQVIASSHSGWRGTVGKIGEETVKKMKERFGSDAKDIIAVVGPSICQSCYEVSEDVIEQFREAFSEQECKEIFMARPEKEGKYLLDLWAANYFVLKNAGITPENIHISGVCTCCNDEILFSHRASKGKRGNLNGLLWLK